MCCLNAWPCCDHHYWLPYPEDLHIDDNGDLLIIGTMYEIQFDVLENLASPPDCLPGPDLLLDVIDGW